MIFAFQIGPEEKADFLEALSQGMKPNRAAKECDSTGTQFRKLRNPVSPHYDADFKAAWDAITESPGYRRDLEERVRDMVWDSAEEGNISMRWKLALTYLPEFEWAKHQNLNVNMQMNILTRALPSLTTEELERVLADLEKGKPALRGLPAPADVDAA